jgi:hypothetical protein
VRRPADSRRAWVRPRGVGHERANPGSAGPRFAGESGGFVPILSILDTYPSILESLSNKSRDGASATGIPACATRRFKASFGRPDRQQGLDPAWREPEPKPEYDIVIIGGGGHGLATAYYLAKEFGLTQRGGAGKGLAWVGQYRAQHHDHPLQLPAAGQPAVLRAFDEALGNLEQDTITTRWSRSADPEPDPHRRPARRLRAARQRDVPERGRCGTGSMRATSCARCAVPRFRQCALSHQGRALPARGGTARHDAVAWGYARGADSRGVDIIQNCEVTGFEIENGACRGGNLARGDPRQKVAVCVAGNSAG